MTQPRLQIFSRKRDAAFVQLPTSLLAQVDETLRRANTLFDTPRSVKTGYGRPVSFYPKPMR